MISYIKGKIIRKEPPFLEIESNGFGFSLFASINTISSIGPEGAESVVFTHIVLKEDSLLAFGFSTQAERELFKELIKIPGIGPKTALGILSNLTPQEFVNSVSEERLSTLIKLPGVGKKTAERIFLEFREKKNKFSTLTTLSESSTLMNLLEDAIAALDVLGYPENKSRIIVNKVLNEFTHQGISLELVIKEALKQLNK
ncbi:MAG: Holliday junction branch migration protein RuvA [Candidatus Kapaibacteriales bacterium]